MLDTENSLLIPVGFVRTCDVQRKGKIGDGDDYDRNYKDDNNKLLL